MKLLRLLVVVLIFAVVGAMAPLFAADRSPTDGALPTAKPRHYIGASTDGDAVLGDLTLSTTSAHFAKMKGRMKLEYVGVLPAFAGASYAAEFGGASVYRVTNAESIFAANRNNRIECDRPTRYLAVTDVPLQHGYVTEPEIWLWQLTIEDWREFDPKNDGVGAKATICMGATFDLK